MTASSYRKPSASQSRGYGELGKMRLELPALSCST